MRKRNQRRRCSGFTLVELIAVMIILGLLAGVVTIGINSQVKKARVRATISQIAQLEQSLSAFHLECGFYPQSMEGLITSSATGRPCKGYPREGFLSKKELPLDPWKNSYNYAAPGVHNTDTYDLWSNGPDGEEGSSDDVSNWKAEEEEEQKS